MKLLLNSLAYKIPLTVVLALILPLNVNFAFASLIQDTSDWQEHEYSQYLAKIINPELRDRAFVYDFQKLNYDQKIKAWLEQVDKQFDTNYRPAFNADFEFVLEADGSLKSLKLLELREHDVEKFRDFVAYMMELKLPAPPDSIPQYTKFTLNAKWLYLERNESLEDIKIADEALNLGSKLGARLKGGVSAFPKELRATLKELENLNTLKVSLEDPSFIDFPSVGETILLKVSNCDLSDCGYPVGMLEGALLKAKIININRKQMILITDKILLKDGSLVQKNLSWSLPNASAGKAFNYAESMASGAAVVMAQVGLGPMIATKGIAAGAAAGVGMLSGVVKEMQKNYSFNLAQGDIVTIYKGDAG